MVNENQKFYGWYLVAALWVIYLINCGFPMYGASVMNAYMVKDLQISRSLFGFGFMLFVLTQGLPGPLVGKMISKKGIKFTLSFGTVLLGVSSILMATVVNNPWVYIFVMGILLGTGGAFGTVLPVQAGVTLWFTQKRSLALSIATTAAGLGGFIAAPILNKIIASSGGSWQTAWIVAAATTVVSLLIVQLFVKNHPSDLNQVPDGRLAESDNKTSTKVSSVYRTTENWETRKAMRSPVMWLVFMGAVGYFVPYMVCLGHGTIYLMNDRGIDPALAAITVGLITLFGIVGRLIGGILGDRIEPRYIWSSALVFMIIGLVSLMSCSSKATIIIYAVCVGIGFGASYICLPTILANYFGVNSFPGNMGMMLLILQVFGCIFPFLAGVAFDKLGSYNIAFIVCTVLSILGIFSLLFARPPKMSANNTSHNEGVSF